MDSIPAFEQPHDCETGRKTIVISSGDNQKNNASVCDGCDKIIGHYVNMHGFGYRSQSIDHYHFHSVGGIMGKRAVYRQLCLECYREDFKKVYPEKELPV